MAIQRLAPNNWEPSTYNTKRRPSGGVVLPVQDPTAPPTTGNGITFTDAADATLWAMAITLTCSRTLRCTIRATSWAQAKAFAQHRHPTATTIQRLPNGHPL